MKGKILRTSAVTLVGVIIWMILHFNLENKDMRLIMDMVMGIFIGWTTAAAWDS